MSERIESVEAWNEWQKRHAVDLPRFRVDDAGGTSAAKLWRVTIRDEAKDNGKPPSWGAMLGYPVAWLPQAETEADARKQVADIACKTGYSGTYASPWLDPAMTDCRPAD